MVVPVVQHDRAEQRRARHAHQHLIAALQGPHFHRLPIVHPAEQRARVRQALLERRHEFRRGLGCRLDELRWRVESGPSRDLGHAAGHGRDVQRELAQRHRFRVRLPSEFGIRHALEHPPGGLRFLFEFLQQRFDDRHVCPPF
jgi:hypothetical protein